MAFSTGRMYAAGWTKLGPDYKVIKSVLVSPNDTSVVYAGAFGWGVFRSSNGGATWNPRQNGLTNMYVRSLAVITDSLLFCGTNDGIYKSTNAGSLWTLSMATPFSVRALGYDVSTMALYAGTYGSGVYRSTDLGGSWTPLTVADPLSSETLSHVWSLGVFGADSVYAGGSIQDISAGGALFQSTDAGATWVQVQKSVGIRSSVRSIAVSPNSPSTSLIIGTAAKGVYKSTNGGLNWTQINAETTPGPIEDLQVNAVAFSPTHRFAGTDSLGKFYARDLGDTLLGWNAGTGLPGPAGPVNAIDFNRLNPDEVYLGTEGAGVYRSLTSGSAWTSRNTGLIGTYARTVAVNGNGDLLMGGNFGDGLWRSTNQGTAWTRAESLNTSNSITSIAVTGNPLIVYAGIYGSGVYRSTDGGAFWDPTNTPSLNLFVRSVIADPTNTAVAYAGTGNGVYKTTDGGASWTSVNGGIPPSTAIRTLAIDHANPNVVYAGSDSLFLFRTTNGGGSWANYTAANGFGAGDFDIRAVTVDYAGSAVVYAGVEGGRIYRTTDAGNSWALLTQLPATHSVRSVLIHPNDHAIFFAATFGDGIFVSVDSGNHWAPMNSGMIDPEISALESDGGATPTLYAGTASHGVYRMIYTFVNTPPVLNAIGAKSVYMNQQLLVHTASTDPDGTIPALTASGMPGSAVFTDSLNGRGLFDWTPLPADVGDHVVTFRASDGALADSESVTIHVLDPGASSIVGIGIEAGWNLVSVPVVTGDFLKLSLFPAAASQAYAYTGSYALRDTLETGPGYWLKFAAPDSVIMGGATVTSETAAVRAGWNIVGSVSEAIPVGALAPVPPAVTTSAVYGYTESGGYFTADTIRPGHGYWVKLNQAGELLMNPVPGAAPATVHTITTQEENSHQVPVIAGTLTFRDRRGAERRLTFFASQSAGEGHDVKALQAGIEELPPAPPGEMLDVRFAETQSRAVALHDGAGPAQIPVRLSSGGRGVTVEWDITDPSVSLTLGSGPGNGLVSVTMRGHGSAELGLPPGGVIIPLTSERCAPKIAGGPREFSLEQNHPNPFNPTTTIGYFLPSAARVRLTVFDLLGRAVAELIDGTEAAGHHTAVWNAGNMSSGVYFYRLETTGENGAGNVAVLNRTMFLLR